MRKTAYLIFSALMAGIAVFAAQSSAQSNLIKTNAMQSSPVNLDFEEGETGRTPAGWASPTESIGYGAKLIEEGSKKGIRSAMLFSKSDYSFTGKEFGNLMQSVDAASYRGHRVRFKAAVRIEGEDPKARAQLWMRVNIREREMGFFDNMGDRPIFSSEWKHYEIVGDVDENAAALNFGMILFGKGKAWIDDASIEDLGKVTLLAEPARPLAERGVENLVAFSRLYGYVRFFHPSDEAAATDWERFAYDGVKAVEPAKNSEELARKLEEIFQPIAPTLRVYPTGKQPALPKELELPRNASSVKIVSWRHYGVGLKRRGQSIYSSERVKRELVEGRVPEGALDPGKPFITDLGGGVSCIAPLALFADEKGTLPIAGANQPSVKPANFFKYSGGDRASRLVDVVIAWNVFQHFYPYFDVVKTDWPNVLKQSLSSAASDADGKAFLQTLRHMLAELHDGHGDVYNPRYFDAYEIPAIWDWVEDQLVITTVAATGAGGLQPGDIVLKIDGKPSAAALAEEESLISGATVQWRRFGGLERLRTGKKDSEIKLEVKKSTGKIETISLARNVEVGAFEEPRPPKIHKMEEGVYYVDISRISDDDLGGALPQLEKAKGVIFDLRGYPKVSKEILSYLIDKPVQSARWNIPVVTRPDHEKMEFDAIERWLLQPKAPRLTGKVIFLTDGRAFSYAESLLGIIEAYKLAEIVGGPTAGTNGDANAFVLPGDYSVAWTGMKVLKHDGSQHHGIGIKPTVPISRTIKGVTEGRDEQLEYAVKLTGR